MVAAMAGLSASKQDLQTSKRIVAASKCRCCGSNEDGPTTGWVEGKKTLKLLTIIPWMVYYGFN